MDILDTILHDTIAVKLRNGVYGILELNGHPGKVLHQDGTTHYASPKAWKDAIDYAEILNKELKEKQRKRALLEASRNVPPAPSKKRNRYTKPREAV